MSMVQPKKIHSPRITQPARSRKGRWLLFLFLFGACFIGGWIAHERLAPRLAVSMERPPVASDCGDELSAKDQRIEELKAEKSDLQRHTASLEREKQIDQEAMQKVQSELTRLQDERLALEEELTFLRRLVSDGKAKVLLGLQDFRLSRGEGARVFDYGFTVTHGQENEGWITGRILLSVAGRQHGEAKTLPLHEVSSEDEQGLKMRFRHFQDVTGRIELPAGFEPEVVILEVKPEDEHFAPTIQRFPWQVTG